ncbi:hypothetical protein SK128_025858 [Halocaridina rubra]|uniref:Uncharacterized protein n=1 Tax=Halocaridina rubra TaxID=373956 RepID=A0AAN8ZYY8_HALRR
MQLVVMVGYLQGKVNAEGDSVENSQRSGSEHWWMTLMRYWGVDLIEKLGGLEFCNGKVKFLSDGIILAPVSNVVVIAAGVDDGTVIEDSDFVAKFDGKRWIIK